jgi:hypothetical protein
MMARVFPDSSDDKHYCHTHERRKKLLKFKPIYSMYVRYCGMYLNSVLLLNSTSFM